MPNQLITLNKGHFIIMDRCYFPNSVCLKRVPLYTKRHDILIIFIHVTNKRTPHMCIMWHHYSLKYSPGYLATYVANVLTKSYAIIRISFYILSWKVVVTLWIKAYKCIKKMVHNRKI